MRTLATAVLVLAVTTTSAGGQKPTTDPLDFYKQYLAVLAKATSLAELLPFYTKELATGLGNMPKEMQGNYLKMNTRVLSNLKVVKQDVQASHASYVLKATLANGQPTSGTAKLVKENGAWKVEDEAWSANLPADPGR